MPRTFLTVKERERLAGFPDTVPHWDLITSFTLTDEDHTFLKTYRNDTHRLGVALQLGAVRYLGSLKLSLPHLHPYAAVARPAAAMSALPEPSHWPLGHVLISPANAPGAMAVSAPAPTALSPAYPGARGRCGVRYFPGSRAAGLILGKQTCKIPGGTSGGQTLCMFLS